jgi:hypothetical protein
MRSFSKLDRVSGNPFKQALTLADAAHIDIFLANVFHG